MSKISDQYYFMKKNGSVYLGRFPSRHIQKILEPSGSIAMHYSTNNPNLVEQGVPGGILFFGFEGHNPLHVDKLVLETKCMCKVNVYRKKNGYVMKISALKGGE